MDNEHADRLIAAIESLAEAFREEQRRRSADFATAVEMQGRLLAGIMPTGRPQ